MTSAAGAIDSPAPAAGAPSEHPGMATGPADRLERDEHVCRYCGALASHVDHIRPRRLGGTDSPVNLVAACARCNLRKGGKALRGGRSHQERPAGPPRPVRISLPDASMPYRSTSREW